MTQFNFTTNIEKRLPATGEVFCIDRMTNDYAERHPLDVDGFIESVYEEFVGTKFEESRETLRSIWTAVLSVTSTCGDASLYPNKNNAKRAAAIKVWLRAGDYWRRGFRHGDTLPDQVPMCNITRLEDGGWIALFPKDEHLLAEGHTGNPIQPDFLDEPSDKDEQQSDSPVCCDTIAATENRQTEPRQPDLFAQLQQENERLQARIAELEEQEKQRRPAPVCHKQPQTATATATVPRATVPDASASDNDHAWLQTAGYLTAATVALVIIWQTGLIVPVGLIGLATSGLLK